MEGWSGGRTQGREGGARTKEGGAKVEWVELKQRWAELSRGGRGKGRGKGSKESTMGEREGWENMVQRSGQSPKIDFSIFKIPILETALHVAPSCLPLGGGLEEPGENKHRKNVRHLLWYTDRHILKV